LEWDNGEIDFQITILDDSFRPLDSEFKSAIIEKGFKKIRNKVCSGGTAMIHNNRQIIWSVLQVFLILSIVGCQSLKAGSVEEKAYI
jgi:hypothetical protein